MHESFAGLERTVRETRVHPVRNVIVGLSVTAVALAGAAFAASQSSAASRNQSDPFPTAALGLRANNVSRGGDRTDLGDEAAQRTKALAATAEGVADAQQQAALAARQGELSDVAEQISAESTAIKERGVFLRPTAGDLGSPFGMRLHPILHIWRMHNGDDIGGACGQPIVAATDGVVIKVAPNGFNGGSGHNVRVDDGDINGVNVQTAYLHMDTIVVKVGQHVSKGELLGTVGSTGLSTACHLHFSVYENGKAVDPLKKYLHL